jgi:uncharacterized membrane-anchored protein YhcB (DUF1043 family)
MKIRFQHWMIGMVAALVVVMAVGFLVTVFRTFSHIAEDTAQQQFSQTAALASQKLETMVHQSADLVKVRAGGDRNAYVEDGNINPHGDVFHQFTGG